MAKHNTDPSQRLHELITERQQYESWISTLESRRQSAPAHVYARVEEDYRGRLSRVREELAKRATELRERIGGLAERLASVQKDEAARRDRKAEAELRAAVGEYSEEKWASMAAEADREIAALVAQREEIEREMSELRQVLEQSTGAVTPPVPPARPAAPAVADATRVEPRVEPRATAPRKDIVEPMRSTPPGGVYITKSGELVQRQASATSPPASAPAVTEASAAAVAVETEAESAQPRRRREQEKTLKCNECGTVNYPTEWYCESCGAELAAL